MYIYNDNNRLSRSSSACDKILEMQLPSMPTSQTLRTFCAEIYKFVSVDLAVGEEIPSSAVVAGFEKGKPTYVARCFLLRVSAAK